MSFAPYWSDNLPIIPVNNGEKKRIDDPCITYECVGKKGKLQNPKPFVKTATIINEKNDMLPTNTKTLSRCRDKQFARLGRKIVY